MTRQLQPCGTESAYKRHLARGEPVDDACQAAHRRYMNAANRAKSRLAAAHPGEYAALFAAELERAEADP